MAAAETSPNRPWWKWLAVGLLVLLALLLLAGVGGHLWLRSSAGLGFIERQIEGRQLGPIAGIEIDGLEGNPLDALTIDELRVRDPEGVWLIIRDLEVDYDPFAFRDRHIDIDEIVAREVEALRRPTLLEVEPSGNDPFRVTVERAGVERIILQEPVANQYAELTAEGAFAMRPDGSITVKLDADRLDAPGEAIDLDFARDANGDMTGDFDLAAPAGGPIATLLRAPEGVDVAGEGQIRGTVETGAGDIVLRFDGDVVADATTRWTSSDATASGTVAVGAWPAFEAISSRTGDSLDFEVALDRTTQDFDVDVRSPDLTLNAAGILPEEGGLPTEADIDLVSDTPAKLLPLPDGYRFGRIKATGRATRDLSFDGDVALSAVTTPYFDAGTVQAPVKLRRNDDGTFDISTDARLRDLITKQALPIDLARTARVNAVLRLNPEAQRLRLQAFTLESGDQRVTATGTVRYGEPLQLDLSGRANVRTNAVGAVPPGDLVTDYRLQSAPGLALPAITAEGSFAPRGELPSNLGELIGERVNFDVAMQPLDGGALRIDRGIFAATNLNAAVTGTVGDTLDLTGEARVLNPVTLATATLGADSLASFTVTGARTDPNVRVDATLPSLSLNGQELSGVRLRADVSDVLTNPRGPVQIEAQTQYGELVASADLASDQGLYAASDIDIRLGRIAAGGDVRVVGDGLYSGRLTLNLPRDGDSYAEAALILEPRAGMQGVDLSASAREVQLFGYDVAYLEADASGTLDRLAGDLELKGREDELLGRRLEVTSPFTLIRTDGTYTATLSPEGTYSAIEFAPRGEVTISYGNGRLALDVPMRVNDGTVDLDFVRANGRETLQASFADLPVQTFPLPVGFGETQGLVSGTANFASAPGQPPQGRAEVKVADFRGRLVDAGDGLTLTTTARLEPGRLLLRLDDGGREFDIEGQARIPLTQAASLTALRPDTNAPFTARLDASGPAERLFNIFAPEDSDPSGALDIDVAGSGTLANPRLTGSANGSAIRFEAPVAGTRIREGRFSASFTRNSVTVTDLFARDGKDGTLQGSGGFELVNGNLSGELETRLAGFRAIDRRDYTGRLDGTLAYAATGEAGTLKGDLVLERAEVKQIVGRSSAQVVNLVIDREVGTRENDDIIEVPRNAIPIALDINLRAPRRVFIRARGIDMEAALDLQIKGTVGEPLIYGEAEVLRGGLTIASKELDFEDGTIVFNGPISESRIQLEAVSQTPTLTARVEVKGTVAAPEIELSSTPDRPEDEILSALLFGRSATQLSALEAAQLAQGLATLSGSGGGFDLVGGLRDALGFSSLDVGVDDSGNALLSGGRYLAKDVYLELFTGGEAGAGGAIISWEIRPDVVLRSKVGTDNEQAFAVLYERDF